MTEEKNNLKKCTDSAITYDTLLSDSFSIREFAEKKIYRCKESAYGKNTDASNVGEGDYGTWDDWQRVLEEFAVFVLKNYR
jgi:hypothetical protein